MADKQSTIVSILQDLTHLQIDTILKSGMIAVDPPERVEDLLSSLHEEYVSRVEIILRHNDVSFSVNRDQCKSFQQLYEQLKSLDKFLKDNLIRVEDADYIILQRIYSFCKFIENKKYAGFDLYKDDMKVFAENKTEGTISARELAKLKRFHDLGTEKVVMQTRIGIDGDIVARIDEEFAKKPLPLLVDLHDKHTKLSMEYWNSLVGTVVNLVTGIFKKH